MKFRVKKRYISVLIYFLCLSQISRGFKVLHKIPGYFQGSGTKINSRLFKGFNEPSGTLLIVIYSYL